MDKFDFNYSAPTEEERQEIQSLRMEYSPKQNKDDALSRMRALDKKVKLPAHIAAWIFGIAGTLILGVGMCMSMEVIRGGLILGTIIGLAGIALVSVNYLIYKCILNARKKKYGEQILQITEQLLNGKQ